jgi:outer membrane murein-binding lipoprotein Lpp
MKAKAKIENKDLSNQITALDQKIDQGISNLSQKIDKNTKELKQRIDTLDKKIDQREMSLLAEIRLTANETKEDMRQEFSTRIDKLYNHMDAFIKEIRDSRDERTVVGHRLKNHDDRLNKLESSVFA